MGLFSEIPRHNQIDVLKKLHFKEFTKFKQCSQETVEITKNFKKVLPLQVMKTSFDYGKLTMATHFMATPRELDCAFGEHVRLEAEKLWLPARVTNERFEYLQNIVQKTKLTVKEILTYGVHERNQPSMFDKLIILLNSTSLGISFYPSCIISQIKEFKRLKRITCILMTIDDSDLINVKVPQFVARHCDTGTTAINTYLKQWMQGEREIELLSISPIPKMYLTIFEDLDLTTIWSSESAEDFPFKLEEIEKKWIKKIFSLKRKDGMNLCIVIYDKENKLLRINAKEYKDVKEMEKWIEKNYDMYVSD